MRRVLLSLFFVGATLLTVAIVAVSGLIFWAVRDPQSLWRVVEARLLPADLRITWDRMAFQGERAGGLDFRLNWEVEGLRIRKERPKIDAPVELLRAQLSFDYPRRRLTVHELTVHAPAPARFVPETAAPAENPRNVYQQLQDTIALARLFKKYVVLQTVAADVGRFELGDPVSLSIRGRIAKNEGDANLRAFADLGVAGKERTGLAAALALNLEKLGEGDPFLEARISVDGWGVTTTQELTLADADGESRLSARGPMTLVAGQLKLGIVPVLDVRLSEKEAVTALTADVRGIPGPIVRARGISARMTTPLSRDVRWSEQPSNFAVTAPVELYFIDRNMRKPLEESCRCRIPESLRAAVEGHVWLATLLGNPRGRNPLLDARLSLESVKNRLLSIDLAGRLRIEREGEAYAFAPEVDLAATVHSYQGVRRFLDAKNILIPAPLDVLDGEVSLTARGPVALGAEEFEFPSTLAVRLRSRDQVVNASAVNTVRIARDFKRIFLDVRAKVADLQLEVPPLDPLRGNPRVLADRRVLTAPVRRPADAAPVIFGFAVSVETTRPGAIRLLSPYFEPHLPITARLTSRTLHPLGGELRLEPFAVTYLRRTMRVEKLTLDLDRAPTGVIPVDGRFRIDQAQYKIFIDVRGPVQKPAIEMSSEPYLPQDEIVSVLLYGRTSEQLVAADAETAGSVKAAVEDRAIGLFGLWAFAATPIKSFSYNPVTKVYTATVALSDDTTAGIGTNWEQTTNLELRKRITGKWMLTAAWVPGAPGEADKTQLVFQWENRY